MRMLRKFIQLTLLSGLLVSCVSTKKYDSLVSDYAGLKDDIKLQSMENDSLSGVLNKRLRNLRDQNISLESDTLRMGQLSRMLNVRYTDLNQTFDALVNQNDNLLSQQAEENKRLADSLHSRDLKLQSLEQLIAEKEAGMIALKSTLSSALSQFEGKGLTVEHREGKVYVSLENSLLFPSGSWMVDKKGSQAIAQLANVLKSHPELQIIIEGHTDDIPYKSGGAIKDNWDLSVKRATSIVKLLTKNAEIDPKQISAAGRSEYNPVADNETKSSRAKNRRIEVIIIPNLDEINSLLKL